MENNKNHRYKSFRSREGCSVGKSLPSIRKVLGSIPPHVKKKFSLNILNLQFAPFEGVMYTGCLWCGYRYSSELAMTLFSHRQESDLCAGIRRVTWRLSRTNPILPHLEFACSFRAWPFLRLLPVALWVHVTLCSIT